MTIPTHGGRAVAAEPAARRGDGPSAAPPSRGARRRAVPRPGAAGRSLLAALLRGCWPSRRRCGDVVEPAARAARAQRLRGRVADRRLHRSSASDFTAAHPGVKVTFNFAGSNDLVTQLQQGAPADVLATADTNNMDAAGDLVGAPQAFAGNKLVDRRRARATPSTSPGSPTSRARTSRSCWRRRRCPPASTPRRSSPRPASR